MATENDETNTAGMTEENQGPWDGNTQTFHGGQDWKGLANFTEDFSVTTNGLGTPAAALAAARDSISTICHYPPADFEPHRTDLCKYLWPESWQQHEGLVQLGNGASELIDLVIRTTPQRGGWRPGPTQTQYKEYCRSSEADDRKTCEADDRSARLTCMVNPTNPTGDYMDVETIKRYISDNHENGSTVIVDESMQPWLGAHWREDSLIHQRDWVAEMSTTRQIDVWVMTSWTKIWSCTGIRLGSVVAPSVEHLQRLKRKQVPWSVNNMCLAFLSEVVKDDDYMAKTWELTPQWNTSLRARIARDFPSWRIHGENLFLSWIWVDTGSAETTEEAVRLAKAAGCPVRSGAPGYNLPTWVRIAVRPAEPTKTLLDAWAPLAEGPSAKKSKTG